MTFERTPSMMLRTRGFSVCCETASSASSSGSADFDQRRELTCDQREVAGAQAALQVEVQRLVRLRGLSFAGPR